MEKCTKTAANASAKGTGLGSHVTNVAYNAEMGFQINHAQNAFAQTTGLEQNAIAAHSQRCVATKQSHRWRVILVYAHKDPCGKAAFVMCVDWSA